MIERIHKQLYDYSFGTFSKMRAKAKNAEGVDAVEFDPDQPRERKEQGENRFKDEQGLELEGQVSISANDTSPSEGLVSSHIDIVA